MDLVSLMLFLALLGLLFFLLVRYMTASHDTFKKMGIDIPPKSWLLGHFTVGVKLGLFDVQTVFYNQFKDKKAYGWYDSRVPVLIIRDLDMIRDICVKNFNQFTDRRRIADMVEPPFDHNLLNLTGEHWKHVRNSVSPTFSSGRVKKMSKHVEKNVKILLDKLREKQERNEEIDLNDICYNFTLNIIASTGFGLDINTLEDPDNRFATEARRMISISPVMLLLSMMFPPLTRLLMKLGFCAFPKKPMMFFADIVDSALSNRKEDGQAGKVNDFLDLVLEAEKEAVQSEGGGLTRSEIHGQALLFLFAGYDTVASALSFTLFLLAVHPECCRKAQEEIDQKVGKESPNYDNVQELIYLEMCINETLRVFPPGMFTDRTCVEDTTIQGIQIPKGMITLIPIYAIHHDPEIWPDPEKFDPERFTPENKASRHNYAFMPFGQGPRNCVGMRLALLELRIAIASILQKFDLVPCDKTVYPVKLSKFFLKANDGIWVKLEARK